jgi:hypothetical protein
VKATVPAHEYLGGGLAAFRGPHRLADDDSNGNIIHAEWQAA